MTSPVVDPVAQPILDALLGCLEEQMARVPSPPGSVCMRPGDQVALLISRTTDECCTGLAWVRLDSIYPSTNFPTQEEGYTKCPPGWAVVVELGVARCAPVGDEDHLPSCDKWTETVNHVTADAAALRRTILQFQALPDFRFTQTVSGTWGALAVEGGCVGGAQTVTVQAPACDTLED